MKPVLAASACAFTLVLGRHAAAADRVDPSQAAREACQALTAQGRRQEAVLACSRAVETERSRTNVRALVSALVDGPVAPTAGDLMVALGIIAAEHDRGSRITAAAAACDVAQRMGDMVMMQRCTGELLTIAPQDPATAEASAVLAADCPSWKFWAGWGALLVTSAATITHAARRRRSRGAAFAAVAVATACVFASPAADAQEAPTAPLHGWLSKWPIDDANPEKTIPSEKERNADPLSFGYWLQDLTWKAESASHRGDYLQAAKLYKALSIAVPDRAVGFVKACDAYEAAGDGDGAIEACGQALLRDGLTVRDYTHFVDLVLAQPRPLQDKERIALDQVLIHMREDPAGHDVVDDLECRIGARTSDVHQLEACTAALQASAPDDARTISYLWALAVARGDSEQAQGLLGRARTAGVPAADVERMAQATSRGSWLHRGRIALYLVAAALLISAMVVAVRSVVERRRLAAGH